MLQEITVKGDGKTIPFIENGSLVILNQADFAVLGVLRTFPKVEIENLFFLNDKLLNSMDIRKNGTYEVSPTLLKKMQYIEEGLRVRKLTTASDSTRDILILLDEGMLVIGHDKFKDNISSFSSINELSFYKNSIYTFIEAMYPEEIDEERQFLYECPAFYFDLFKKIINRD
jgi:hypothetical protein